MHMNAPMHMYLYTAVAGSTVADGDILIEIFASGHYRLQTLYNVTYQVHNIAQERQCVVLLCCETGRMQ